jgi:hypothetical protein
MIHKSYILPGLSQFIDKTVLSQYPPTSFKRIIASGAIALYLNKNADIVDTVLNNPMISSLGISTPDNMVDLEALRDVYKAEIAKAGFMRIHFPILGDVDFTAEDVDTLYRIIMSLSTPATSVIPSPQTSY